MIYHMFLSWTCIAQICITQICITQTCITQTCITQICITQILSAGKDIDDLSDLFDLSHVCNNHSNVRPEANEPRAIADDYVEGARKHHQHKAKQ